VTTALQVFPVTGIGEVRTGDDVAELIAATAVELRDGDIVVVTSKVVSKSEGRMLVGADRDEAVSAETVRVVAERGSTRIVETKHGFVLAAGGVDASNVPAGTVALLPEDPDASAERIRRGLRRLCAVDVGVLVTDTMGRPWRNGLVDVAIGAAGVEVLDDHRGRVDAHGHTLEMTVTAIGDEVAAAAELVKGKLDGVPVAVVRGLAHRVREAGGAQLLVRRAEEDMFRWGAREAVLRAVDTLPGRPTGTRGADPVAVAQAVQGVDLRGLLLIASPREPLVEVIQVVAGQVTTDPPTLLGIGMAIQRLASSLVAHGVRADVRWEARPSDPAPPDGMVVAATLDCSTVTF
jgi:coenzyme F420-0:L-glutamate ligase/coenzyme F420-1:gamma-L-glutamate ligase